MLVLGTDWATISSLATGAGTLVLAVATFASVRSSNRSARIAEEALLEQRQPVFSSSRFDDPAQKVMFIERNFFRVEGGRAVAEYANGNIYLAISLRNVGSGIGVCQAWAVGAGLQASGRVPNHRPEPEFRAQTRDLFVPPGDIGIWQGALRELDDPDYAGVVEAIQAREPISVELCYSDLVGGQRTITRFGLISNRHWFLDRPGPRSEEDIQARAEVIFRSVEAAEAEVAAEAAAAASAAAQPDDGFAVDADGADADDMDASAAPEPQQARE
jgi:hypothetical protein